MNAKSKKVEVIGAGFSGLTCAYYLVKAGFEVEIFEKSNRSGGLIGTLQTPFGLVETAANGLLNSELLEILAKDIGLKLLAPLKSSKARYIFRGKPSRFPLKVSEIPGLLKFIFKMFFAKSSILPKPNESLRAWGIRNLGYEASHYTIESALQGVYAGDPQKLSARLVLSMLTQKRNKSIARGSRAPLAGMIELTQKLQDYLTSHGVKFNFGQSQLSLAAETPVVIATPAYEASLLLQSLEPELSVLLCQIDYLPVVTANLFFAENSLRGFGCLFPPEESNIVLGVLMNDCIFEGRAQKAASENWILGGAFVKESAKFISQSDEQILELVLARRNLFKKTFAGDILGAQITRWPKAFPSYSLELEKLLPKLEPKNQNVFLHGNYLGDLGLTKIIERSQKLAQKIEALHG